MNIKINCYLELRVLLYIFHFLLVVIRHPTSENDVITISDDDDDEDDLKLELPSVNVDRYVANE